MFMKAIFKITATVVACAFGAVAHAQSFDGVYSGSLDGTRTAMSCNLDYQGSDGGPIVISRGQYFGVESYCELRNPTPIRDIDGILYDAVCSSEGIPSASRMLLIRSYNQVYMHHNGYMRELFTCR